MLNFYYYYFLFYRYNNEFVSKDHSWNSGHTLDVDASNTRSRNLEQDDSFVLSDFVDTEMRSDLMFTPGNICTFCGLNFRNSEELQIHMISCSFRDRNPSNDSFVTHLSASNSFGLFECEYCQKMFRNRCSFQRHIRLHTGENLLECNICHKKFTLKGHLVEHERIHTGERPYLCKLCGASFTCSSSVSKHIKRNHNK